MQPDRNSASEPLSGRALGGNVSMAKLIVGLGNPGKEYAKTRHNVGFWCVERVCDKYALQGEKSKWHSLVTEGLIGKEKVYLLRPQTYMNLSGQAVQAAVQFLQLEAPRDVIVVYDDLDLPAGSLRLREKGSAGGHNGIKSIISHLGTDGFARIRIGIGRPPFDVTVTDYVLSGFAKSERPLIDEAVNRAADAAGEACESPFVQVMNRFNTRS